ESSEGEAVSTNLSKEFKVFNLIQAYRERGHLISTTNPIRPRLDRHPKLDITSHGLTNADLEESFVIGELIGLRNGKLKDILAHLKDIYAGNIGVEFSHINDVETHEWFRNKFESTVTKRNFDISKKKRILSKLNEA